MSEPFRSFLSKEEHEMILQSISRAEKNTSGEIRLYIEACCKEDVLDHSAFIFSKLEMHKTKERNGVLFYLAFQDKKFAIIGDAGINAVVEKDFWNHIKEIMSASFKKGDFFAGLNQGISMAGDALKKFFPYTSDDVNELSDDIIFGDEKE
jgi:uncharacterized membrane protein